MGKEAVGRTKARRAIRKGTKPSPTRKTTIFRTQVRF